MRRSGTRSLGKSRCSWHERGAATFDPRQIEIARPHTVDRVDPLDLHAHAAMTGATARTGLSLTAKPWHHLLVKEATRPLVDDRFNLRGFLGEGQSHWSRRADLSFDNLSFARSGGGGLRADCARSAPSEPDRNRDWHRDRHFEGRDTFPSESRSSPLPRTHTGSSDRYTVTVVPGGAKISLEVTVPLRAGHQPVEPISLERRAEILRRIKAEIPGLIPAPFRQCNPQ
jgi:hypothetical protein